MAYLTVLMAVRNGERTVGEAVGSILDQSFTDFEFLVVNDGSTDGTAGVLASFDDERLTVVENERHSGLTWSLNQGLALTSSAYVARQDADDRSSQDRFARQVEFLDSHPDVALVGTWYRKIDEEGRVLASEQLPVDSTHLRWHLIFYSPFVHSAVMLRRSALESVGVYDESLGYAQDYDLWCRIARRFGLANLDDHLVDFRVSPKSMTETYGEAVVEEPRDIARSYLNDLYGGVPGEPHIETISALLFRPHLLTASDDVAAAAQAALRHHDAFSHFFALPDNERAEFRSNLARRLERRLGRLAFVELRRGHFSEARRLLAAALVLESSRKPG
jgi:glycosyltransferase involved in cell wall biosynthesis